VKLCSVGIGSAHLYHWLALQRHITANTTEELKYDGFRALAYIKDSECRLVSRKGSVFKSFADLCADIARELKAQFAVLDGEIVYLDEHGKPQFYELMRRKADRCFFYAFDLLSLNGEDLQSFPLLDRKRRLKKLIPKSSLCRLRYLDHVEEQGIRLFESACALDLEGVVAKLKSAPYAADERHSTWIKIKNESYTQAEGRHDFFDKLRESASQASPA
jgi:bifunctional non-homologous end joining protein LigD